MAVGLVRGRSTTLEGCRSCWYHGVVAGLRMFGQARSLANPPWVIGKCAHPNRSSHRPWRRLESHGAMSSIRRGQGRHPLDAGSPGTGGRSAGVGLNDRLLEAVGAP